MRAAKIMLGLWLSAVVAGCHLDAPTPPERERLRVMIPSTYREQIKALLASDARTFSFKYDDVEWVEMPWYTGRDAVFAPSLAARFADSDPDADVLFLDLYRLGSFRPTWLERLDAGPLEKVAEDYRPAFLGAARIGTDAIFAIPWSAQANFLFYRKDLIAAPPKTWGEVRTACEALKPPRGMRYCLLVNWDSLENDLYPALWSLGASGAHLESPQLVDFATELSGWFGLELSSGFKMLPGPKQAPDVGRDVHKRFLNGEAAFMITWSNRYHYMVDDAKASKKPMPPTAIAAIPPVVAGGPAYSNVGTWGWIVPASRARPTPISDARHDKALRFVEEVSSREAAEYLVKTTGLLPARRDVALPEEVRAALDPIVRDALEGKADPAVFRFKDRGADAFTHGFVRDAFRDLALCRTVVNRPIPSSLIGDCARYYEECVQSDTPSTDCLRKAISRRLKAAQKNVLVVSPGAETE